MQGRQRCTQRLLLPLWTVAFVRAWRRGRRTANGGCVGLTAKPPCTLPSLPPAVLVAEVVHHYFPKLVELHNYSAANSLRQKLYNWGTLNTKVFRRLGGFEVKRGDVEAIVNCKPGVIEAVLMQLQQKVRGGSAVWGVTRCDRNAALSAPCTSRASRRCCPTRPARLPQMAEYRAGKRAEGGSGESYGSPSAAARGGSVTGGGDYMDSAHTISQYAGGGQPLASSSAGGPQPSSSSSAEAEAALAAKDSALAELRETVEILELKIKKLEQLVLLKDNRIATLQARLAAASGPQ
jgi:hypothetical protein